MMATRRTNTPPIFLQLLTALWLGVAAALALIVFINIAVSIAFSGRIFPGVSINGKSLSGLSVEQAAVDIAVSSNYPETGKILLAVGEKTWLVRPVDLGIFLDPASSAVSAYNIGRKGSILGILNDRFGLLRKGVDAHPAYIYNQTVALDYLLNLSREINQPLREASLAITGTEVTVNNGQPGRVLDIQASLAAITRQIESMQDGIVPLVVIESNPLILDASVQGELARGILSQPLLLTLPQEAGDQSKTWRIEPNDLAKLLTFERNVNGDTTELKVVVSKPLMMSYLESIKNEADVVPENARFIFNDETAQLDLLTPAVVGRQMDIEKSVDAINTSIENGEHSAVLTFVLTDPPVTDKMTGAELGITELVYAYTSYFYGSSSDRVQNIATASARFHGLLVPPGGTLSMSDELGDISLDNGYAEALIILGDETIQGVGGGVCQVSTTLFRTVYYSGLQIVERHPHAYRVGYYEQISGGGHSANLAGLDATVFVPLVDFKFKNDTDHWLLMETYVGSYSLTWKFYSTKDGRVVSSESTGITNVVKAPKPLYRENPELSKGQIKQVDYGVDGADVVVTRTVTRGNVTLYIDRIVTHYQAWRDIFEYGPGTDLPKDKNQ